MPIKKYFDNELKKECFQARVTRSSSIDPSKKVDRRITKIESHAEALKIEKKLCFEVERLLMQEESKSTLWENLIEEWELAHRNNDIFVRPISEKTREEYYGALRNYTREWFKLPANEIDRARAWLLLDRVDRDISISMRKRLKIMIDAIFNWGILSGRLKNISSLPTDGYKSNRKEEEKMPEILTLDEIKTLLSYSKSIDHEWYPVWAVALFTGMRSGELYALEWDVVDFENKMLYVHRNWTSKTGFGPTKGRYWRAVPLADQFISFLKELKLKRGNEKFVLPHFKLWDDGEQASVLREFCTGVGLPSVKFHTLRACFATQLIKDGIAPAVVMKICGWKDLKTMQRYIRLAGIEVKGATAGLKLLPETEVMGRVVNLFSPK